MRVWQAKAALREYGVETASESESEPAGSADMDAELSTELAPADPSESSAHTEPGTCMTCGRGQVGPFRTTSRRARPRRGLNLVHALHNTSTHNTTRVRCAQLDQRLGTAFRPSPYSATPTGSNRDHGEFLFVAPRLGGGVVESCSVGSLVRRRLTTTPRGVTARLPAPHPPSGPGVQEKHRPGCPWEAKSPRGARAPSEHPARSPIKALKALHEATMKAARRLEQPERPFSSPETSEAATDSEIMSVVAKHTHAGQTIVSRVTRQIQEERVRAGLVMADGGRGSLVCGRPRRLLSSGRSGGAASGTPARP